MKKKLAVIAAALISLAGIGQASAYDVKLSPFPDVSGSDWFGDAVYTLSAIGMVDGYEDGTFRPDDKLTREAFIKLLVTSHVGGLTPVQPTGSPSDVDAARWSYPYIAPAFDRHWLDPLLDQANAFHPESAVMREEAAAVIGRSLLAEQSAETQAKWRNGEWTKERDSRSFSDSVSIDEKLAPDVYYAVHAGILEGDDDGFRPHDILSRKEAAMILQRLLDAAAGSHKLDVTGFYAISSYGAINRMPLLSDVSFGWSHLQYDEKGKVTFSTDTTDYEIPDGWQEAVQAASQAKLPKELMVYGEKDASSALLQDPAAEESFLTSLLTTLRDTKYGFTGVTVDMEGLKDEALAPAYSEFLKKLRTKLNGLSLSVTVPPTYYYKGYDLAAIGKTADRVILMDYDFTHEASMLPSAPLPLVSDALKQALLVVPKEKLVLGISKQANQWITDSTGTSKLYSPLIADVEKRMKDPAVTQTWMLPYFLKELTFSDSRGKHLIYYEDTESIQKKVWLAKVYGLKGVSLWHMGNFTESDWNLFVK